MSRMVVALGISLVLASLASAQAIQPIYVEIQLPREIENRLPDDIKSDRLQELRSTLSKHLKGGFPYWDFQPRPNDELPCVRVELYLGTDDTAGLSARVWVVRKLANLMREDDIKTTLLIFGRKEYDDLLNDSNWQPLFDQIGSKFLSQLRHFRKQVLDDLKPLVHVGMGALPANVPLTDAVLPLPWDKFAAYSKSRFKIDCIAPAGATLFSEAIGQSFPWTMPKGLFLWVRHESLQQPGQQRVLLSKLTPSELAQLQMQIGTIYLDNEMENPLAVVSNSETAVSLSP